MTTIINNTFNLNFNPGFNAAEANSLMAGVSTQLAAGIMASYFQPLLASAFASATLPMLFQMQGGTMQQATDSATSSFVPTDGAQWSASMQNESEGSIDLGDGYSLELDERNSEIRIYNDNTGETTRIWGDPHVDIDGTHAFDFWGKTTFQLENGTKITIDTEQFAENPNEYVASQLTITKGDQAIVVDGISQNRIGDLNIAMSNDGQMLDALKGDGFVLQENATGAGWRSELTGDIATQADLNMTRVGAIYGPGSDTPSLGEVSQQVSSFLLFGFVNALTNAAFAQGLSA
ncbi:DUF1521 domain-containing protein [Sphingobium sp. CR2-8]|uniref:DUF1521 domain-containing protein n=1 Tax=Sphingobium sp. CR2-8 TaxID=1306534 RepID=UPI002DB853AC|nr:DUF1521 domain-containing protein [Sphingobium sp. CR2-8]MEC3912560.1 DUF1521 domain-containing protein [Sphingobium sp. CR2-8]